MNEEERYFIVDNDILSQEGWEDGMARDELDNYLLDTPEIGGLVVIYGVKLALRVALKDD